MLGKLLQGRYQIVQVLGAGGFCKTYLAKDTSLPNQPACVIKHLLPASNHTNSLATQRRLFIGTPGYMPTEQGRGRPRPNSDIYALGTIGIQALTGLNPTKLLEDSDTGELIWQQKALMDRSLPVVVGTRPSKFGMCGRANSSVRLRGIPIG